MMKLEEAGRVMMRDMINKGVIQTCINCNRFNAITQKCELFNTTPPAEVIVFSCGKHWMIDIPF